jgi:ankyrin repeat protein
MAAMTDFDEFDFLLEGHGYAATSDSSKHAENTELTLSDDGESRTNDLRSSSSTTTAVLSLSTTMSQPIHFSLGTETVALQPHTFTMLSQTVSMLTQQVAELHHRVAELEQWRHTTNPAPPHTFAPYAQSARLSTEPASGAGSSAPSATSSPSENDTSVSTSQTEYQSLCKKCKKSFCRGLSEKRRHVKDTRKHLEAIAPESAVQWCHCPYATACGKCEKDRREECVCWLPEIARPRKDVSIRERAEFESGNGDVFVYTFCLYCDSLCHATVARSDGSPTVVDSATEGADEQVRALVREPQTPAKKRKQATGDLPYAVRFALLAVDDNGRGPGLHYRMHNGHACAVQAKRPTSNAEYFVCFVARPTRQRRTRHHDPTDASLALWRDVAPVAAHGVVDFFVLLPRDMAEELIFDDGGNVVGASGEPSVSLHDRLVRGDWVLVACRDDRLLMCVRADSDDYMDGIELDLSSDEASTQFYGARRMRAHDTALAQRDVLLTTGGRADAPAGVESDTLPFAPRISDADAAEYVALEFAVWINRDTSSRRTRRAVRDGALRSSRDRSTSGGGGLSDEQLAQLRSEMTDALRAEIASEYGSTAVAAASVHDAALAGDVVQLRLLVERGDNQVLLSVDSAGRTPLGAAAAAGDVSNDAVRFLVVECDADLMASAPPSDTEIEAIERALGFASTGDGGAATMPQQREVERLASSKERGIGYVLHMLLVSGQPLIHCAAARDDSASRGLLELLLVFGKAAAATALATGHGRFSGGRVAPAAAVGAEKVSNVAVTVVDKSGRTALHVARNSGVARRLLAAGAMVNARDNAGDTPLHIAARDGRASTILTLLARGADAWALNRNGEWPLECAVRSRRRAAVHALLRAPQSVATVADVSVKCRPMNAAISVGCDWAVTLLWLHGWRGGRCALLAAVRQQSVTTVRALLRCGAGEIDIDEYDAVNASKLTALHVAATVGNADLVALLATYGARQLASASQNLPIHLAVQNDRLDIVETMLRLYGNVLHHVLTARDAQGRTALAVAAQRGNWAICRLLTSAAPNEGTIAQDRPNAVSLAIKHDHKPLGQMLAGVLKVEK